MNGNQKFKVYIYITLYYEVEVYTDRGEDLEIELCRKFTSETAAFDYVEQLATKDPYRYTFKIIHHEEGYAEPNVDKVPDDELF